MDTGVTQTRDANDHMTAQFAAPIVIESLTRTGGIRRLSRLRAIADKEGKARVSSGLSSGHHPEPMMLPVEEIEPSFRGLRAVCRELALGKDGAKYLDNFLSTLMGG